MPEDWYWIVNEEVRGPDNDQRLQALLKGGAVDSETMVRRGQSGPWRRISEVAALSGKSARSQARADNEPPALPSKRRGRQSNGINVALALVALVSTIAALGLFFARPSSVGSDSESTSVSANDPGAEKPVADEAVIPSVDAVRPPVGEFVPGITSPSGFPGERPQSIVANGASPPSSGSGVPGISLPPQPFGTNSSGASSASSNSPFSPLPTANPSGAERKSSGPREKPLNGPQPLAVPETLYSERLDDATITPFILPRPLLLKPISDEEITRFNIRVRLANRATDALRDYTEFSSSYEFTESQLARVNQELSAWKERASFDLYRLGDEWVELDQLKVAERKSRDFLEQAATHLENGLPKETIKALRGASNANPNDVTADYLLALAYCIPQSSESTAELAQKHFESILRRQPDYPPALNGLAISLLRQRKYGDAIQAMMSIHQKGLGGPELVQNLGRFSMLVEQGRVKAERSVIQRASNMLSEATAQHPDHVFNARTGYLHMAPVLDWRVRHRPMEEGKTAESPARASLKPLVEGTGFLVAPGYILTSRRAVHDERFGRGAADVVGVIDPANPRLETAAVVIAVSDTHDLALLKTLDPTGSPLIVNDGELNPDETMLGIGFVPGRTKVSEPETAEARLAPIPDSEPDLPFGNVSVELTPSLDLTESVFVDSAGRLAAFSPSAAIGQGSPSQTIRRAVSGQQVLGFLKGHLSSFPEMSPDVDGSADSPDWDEVKTKAFPAVRRLVGYYSSGLNRLDSLLARATDVPSVYEDRTCPSCIGLARQGCSQKGCIRGGVTVPYQVTMKDPKGIVIVTTRFRQVPCSVCDGKGVVKCSDCSSGLDRALAP